jgi:hypothetical protein
VGAEEMIKPMEVKTLPEITRIALKRELRKSKPPTTSNPINNSNYYLSNTIIVRR